MVCGLPVGMAVTPRGAMCSRAPNARDPCPVQSIDSVATPGLESSRDGADSTAQINDAGPVRDFRPSLHAVQMRGFGFGKPMDLEHAMPRADRRLVRQPVP